MILISHRGNLRGPDHSNANNPKQIKKTLDLGFDCEVDVWKISENFFLGHDEPNYKVDKKFLENNKLWCHAKNLTALNGMLNHGIHCFWHESDKFTITSKGYIWTFPEEEVTRSSIIVHKDSGWKEKDYQCAGVCTDFII